MGEMFEVDEGYWQALLQDAEANVPGETAERNGAADRAGNGSTPRQIEQLWEAARQACNCDEVLEVQITGFNRGGLLVDWAGLHGFIPASHILNMPNVTDDAQRRSEFERRVGQTSRARSSNSIARMGALSCRSASRTTITPALSCCWPTCSPANSAQVLAWVRNPGVLKPGFFAEVTLAAESHKNAVVVPEGAVQASERGFVSYVVEDGRAHQRPVQIGMRTGDAGVEILSGLKVGELIVTEGSDRLADGIAVAPVPLAAGGASSAVRP